MEIAKYLADYDIDEHIERIRNVYEHRRDLTVQAMENWFPENVAFTRPQGGLFAWVEMPVGYNSRDLLDKCLVRNVAFVPGGSFFPNGGGENTFRLNFSNMTEERLVDGMKRLADTLIEFLKQP